MPALPAALPHQVGSVKLIGLMPVRNEDWCLGLTLRVALMWCDQIVIYMHACTDGSREIIGEVIREHERGRIHCIIDPEPTWKEMNHRQEMLERARQFEPTHIGIIDADEVLSANLLPGIREFVEAVRPGSLLQLPLYYLRGGLNRYHANGIWGERIVDAVFHDDPRLGWCGDRFHSRMPGGTPLSTYFPVRHGGIMHLWGVEERRLQAKCAMYKVAERVRWRHKPVDLIERMYNWAIKGDAMNPQWGTPLTWTYSTVPPTWWDAYKPLMKHIHLGGEPWQEAEVRRAVSEYGRELFAGLDLFGIA